MRVERHIALIAAEPAGVTEVAQRAAARRAAYAVGRGRNERAPRPPPPPPPPPAVHKAPGGGLGEGPAGSPPPSPAPCSRRWRGPLGQGGPPGGVWVGWRAVP